MRVGIVLTILMLWCGSGIAAEVVDATGRSVEVPDHISRVVPAGPPAAVLLEAVAPDLMSGWPMPLSDEARGLIAPAAGTLPQIPRLTGHADVSTAIKAGKPDLIVDYGTVSPRYSELARVTQQRTGIPTILLDGSMARIPGAIRTLGKILHREGRAEALAAFAEALLSLPSGGPVAGGHPTIVYARGPDGLLVAAPKTDVTGVFTRLGWRVLAPNGQGTFRPSSIEAIRALNPDMVIFSDPAMRSVLEKSTAWKTVRAVREGHALIAPSLPFGWVEEPPSINRLVGLAWLSGADPATLASLTNAVVYGHVLTPAERGTVLEGIISLHR